MAELLGSGERYALVNSQLTTRYIVDHQVAGDPLEQFLDGQTALMALLRNVAPETRKLLLTAPC